MSMEWKMRVPYGTVPAGLGSEWDAEVDRGDVDPGGWARLWDGVWPGADADHADPGALGEYAVLRHRHGPAAAQRAFPAVAAHLAAGCARCAADLAELLAFAAEEQPVVPPAAPGEGLLRRVFATRLVPVAARPGGLRGGSGSRPAHPPMTFQTAGAIIVLRVEQEGRRGRLSVNGFVMPQPHPDAAPIQAGEARLAALGAAEGGTGESYAERIDDRGGFVLGAVAPGAYRLELRLGGEVVVIEDLQIARADDLPGSLPS
jgi:hypothetical protein